MLTGRGCLLTRVLNVGGANWLGVLNVMGVLSGRGVKGLDPILTPIEIKNIS